MVAMYMYNVMYKYVHMCIHNNVCTYVVTHTYKEECVIIMLSVTYHASVKHFLLFVLLLQDRETPLHCAAETGQLKTAELLLSKGAELDSRDKVSTCSNVGYTMYVCIY